MARPSCDFRARIHEASSTRRIPLSILSAHPKRSTVKSAFRLRGVNSSYMLNNTPCYVSTQAFSEIPLLRRLSVTIASIVTYRRPTCSDDSPAYRTVPSIANERSYQRGPNISIRDRPTLISRYFHGVFSISTAFSASRTRLITGAGLDFGGPAKGARELIRRSGARPREAPSLTLHRYIGVGCSEIGDFFSPTPVFDPKNGDF
jgi:hypothetical protein